jgi:hypothetical protein
MDRDTQIEQRIRNTLDLLEHPATLEPFPGLYHRMQHRMQTRRSLRSPARWHLRPVLLAVLVVVNLTVAYWYMTGARARHDATKLELMEVLSADLNIDGPGRGIMQ